jgi:hypothetical protein
VPDQEVYTVHLAGRWSLGDLYEFPHAYEQVYFLILSLKPNDDELRTAGVKRIYSAFPWQGGYSAVNFYNDLRGMTPVGDRPAIKSIRYESPGGWS